MTQAFALTRSSECANCPANQTSAGVLPRSHRLRKGGIHVQTDLVSVLAEVVFAAGRHHVICRTWSDASRIALAVGLFLLREILRLTWFLLVFALRGTRAVSHRWRSRPQSSDFTIRG